MKHYLLFVLLLFSLYSCGQKHKQFVNSNLTLDSLGKITRVERTEVVNGWIGYWKLSQGKLGFVTKRAIQVYKYREEEVPVDPTETVIDGNNYNPIYQKQDMDKIYFVQKQQVRFLWKILVNGMDFPLNKKYEFIRDDEIVK